MTSFLAFVIVFASVVGQHALEADSGRWQPAPGLTWQWILDDAQVVLDLDVDAFDLDWESTSAAEVADLHQRGIRAICYVNVGAWEEWRGDANAFPAEVIGNTYDGWEGERFLDIREIDLLAPIMEARFDTCRDKGFDAIEPDNMDAWDDDTGFHLTEKVALAWATWLADAAHARGLAIAQKNAPDLTVDLVDTYDFAITESCAEDGWCDAMWPYSDAGKAVLAAEYTDVTSSDRFQEMCGDRTLQGVSLILKHRELDSWIATCP